MPVFFIKPDQIQGRRVVLTGADARHLQKVLRIQPGEIIRVADGEGALYEVKIRRFKGGQAEGDILDLTREAAEPSVVVTLVQAIPKNPKMETVIQKGVEVGVGRFLPAVTARCVRRLSPDKEVREQARWQKIAGAAAKQSGRGKIPEVLAVAGWREALDRIAGTELIVLPWEGERQKGIRSLFEKGLRFASIAVLIGPEGGFTPAEVQEARQRGAVTVTLGPRILRTETAGLVACALLLHEMGEMG